MKSSKRAVNNDMRVRRSSKPRFRVLRVGRVSAIEGWRRAIECDGSDSIVAMFSTIVFVFNCEMDVTKMKTEMEIHCKVALCCKEPKMD